MYSVLIDLLDQYLHKGHKKIQQSRKQYITVSSLYAKTPPQMQNLEQSRHTKIGIYCVKYFIAVAPVHAEVVYSCIKCNCVL